MFRAKMRRYFQSFICARALPSLLFIAGVACASEINITQYHNHSSRDGLYIDPAFTKSACSNVTRDLAFNGSIVGNMYAQPLYVESSPGTPALIIAATEANNVYALDAATGQIVWQRNVGTPVSRTSLPCGNINPLGITGTPVIDLPSRRLFLDAMTTTNSGANVQHMVYSLDIDTGAIDSGWPVNVGTFAFSGSIRFTNLIQNQRSALAFVNGSVYLTYGGHAGDCGAYHGWIVGVPAAAPTNMAAWATTATGGGSWSPGGIASDGTNLFMATGNTFGASTWGGGEAVIRFFPGPVFSGDPADFWVPVNWSALDGADLDVGGSGPVLVDVPGANPSQLIVALGKDGNAYLLDRSSLGGIGAPVAVRNVAATQIIQAAATYQTAGPGAATYVVYTSISSLATLRITNTSPPSIGTSWTASQGGRGSPFVTSPDGTNDIVVWGIGAEGDQKLHAFDGRTGTVVYTGGGTNEVMVGTRHMVTGIAVHGRIYVATDNKVYAFSVPVAPVTLSSATAAAGSGPFTFSFTNFPGLHFTAFSTTDMSVPLTNWTRLDVATEVSPGQYQFTDTNVSTAASAFYRVSSP